MSILSSRPSLSDPEDPVLGDLIDELARQVQAGAQVDIEAYLQAHPEHAQELRRLLPMVHGMAEWGRSVSGTGSSPALDAAVPVDGLLGDFRILGEAGRGGMGIVYQAEQLSLNRRVALKVLPLAATLDPKHLQRFKNEAHAAASLHHAHIVPVFGVGCERGIHYYAMQFIDGQSLAEVIGELCRLAGKIDETASEQDGPPVPSTMEQSSADDGTAQQTPSAPPPRPDEKTASAVASAMAGYFANNRDYFRKVALLGIQAAEALEYAHQMGVIHRDIKPANLMLDARDNLWITDFGLARMQSCEARVTMTGDILGTVRYMSPEQVLGRQELDPRTDIYSLGATLYELLTLTPAFASADRNELSRQIADADPCAPRRHNKALPADLETIVLKAMAKSPCERYPTAQALADDLGRFLADQPIRARRPTPWRRLRKWTRRHRAVVASAAVLAVVALAVGMILVWRERERGEEERRRADVQSRLTRLARNDAYTGLVQKWLANEPQLNDGQRRQLQRELWLKELDYYRELAQEKGADLEIRLQAALAHRRVGEVQQKLERLKPAEEAYRNAIAAFTTLAADFPAISDYEFNLAITQNLLGRLLKEAGGFQEAEDVYGKALALGARLTSSMGALPDCQKVLAATHMGLGELFRAARRFPEAEQHARQGADLLEKLVADFPNRVDYRSHLANALENLATVNLDQGELTQARELLVTAARHQQVVLKSSSEHPEYREYITNHYKKLFPVLFKQGRHQQAAEEAEAFARTLPDRSCDAYVGVRVLARCAKLAEKDTALAPAEREAVARRYRGRAREFYEEAIRRGANKAPHLDALARLLANDPEPWLRDPAGAVTLAKKAVAMRPQEAAYLSTLGVAEYRAGHWQAAARALKESAKFRSAADAADLFILAMAHWQQNDKAAARRYYAQAAQEIAKSRPDADPRRLQAEAANLLGVHHE